MNIRTAAVAVAALCAAASLTACGADSPGKASGVAITATDSACQVATTSFAPGEVTFTVTNKGKDTTEVYVYGKQGDGFTKVVAEVENVAPGLTREMKATLAGGAYEIACKPGQTGAGIRTAITVSGGSAAATGEAEAAYDREIELAVTATGVTGGDGLTAKAGEKIEFKLENKAGRGPRAGDRRPVREGGRRDRGRRQRRRRDDRAAHRRGRLDAEGRGAGHGRGGEAAHRRLTRAGARRGSAGRGPFAGGGSTDRVAHRPTVSPPTPAGR